MIFEKKLKCRYHSHFSIIPTGSGAFGSVFLCHHVLDDIFLGTFAVKIVPVGYICASILFVVVLVFL